MKGVHRDTVFAALFLHVDVCVIEQLRHNPAAI